MKEWNRWKLAEEGYEISNCQITSADLSMRDHGVLDFSLCLEGQVCVIFGGYVIGHGYLGAKDFEGSPCGIEYIMRIMDVVGVESFNQLKGQTVRVAHKGLGSSVKIIGNIIKENWLDVESFFEDKKENAND